MDTMDATQLIAAVVGLGVTGALAGVLSGLLGVGGGIVIVPVLFWVFTLLGLAPGLAMQLAVGSSLLAVAVTATSAARAHHRRGSLDVALARRWAPWTAVGGVAGGTLAGIVSGEVLMAVFGAVALMVAWSFARPRPAALASELPLRTGVQPAMAAGVGTLSGVMGLGAGTLGVPLLTAFSVPVHRAVGTASALGVAVGLPAALAMVVAGWSTPDRPPLSLGYINLVAVGLILPLSVLCAPLGSRIAHALDPIWIRRAFALFLAVTSARMLLSALG
ncbi:MAG: sulfite exporter TauE/SafE family protein [Alkalilacustris sp.]